MAGLEDIKMAVEEVGVILNTELQQIADRLEEGVDPVERAEVVASIRALGTRIKNIIPDVENPPTDPQPQG